MAETWLADLECGHELGVGCGDIVRGAIAFLVRRGLPAWYRRRWAKAALATTALLISVVFIPPWFLIPMVALGLLVWLIASPARPVAGATNESRTPQDLP